MNILFLYPSEINPQRGGVQNVTYNLSRFFIEHGHSVFFLGFKGEGKINFQYFFPENKIHSATNIRYLETFLKKYHINITIFQCGVSRLYSDWAYCAKKQGSILISCIHNNLFSSLTYPKGFYESKLKRVHMSFLSSILDNEMINKILKRIYIYYKRSHYRKLYSKSDAVVLLSDSFKPVFSEISGIKNLEKVHAIPNPISLTEIDIHKKEKRILYVGRIDTTYKNTDLLLKIWHKLCYRETEWKLDIVGDGPELMHLKRYVIENNIINVHFYGFQDPTPYYEKASVFCLTSSSEGFGIVLVEAMHYGVVPIAFDSFSSVRDIIDDNVNGVLIPPFNIEQYAQELEKLINDRFKMQRLSLKAKDKAMNFDLNAIGQRWLDLINNIQI